MPLSSRDCAHWDFRGLHKEIMGHPPLQSRQSRIRAAVPDGHKAALANGLARISPKVLIART